MPSSFSITDIGRKREMNQDYVFTSDIPLGSLSCLYLVADGMGGHRAGEFASKYTVETIVRFIGNTIMDDPQELLNDAFHLANTEIRRIATYRREFFGMGTTLVACTVADGQLLVANVGDSRLYLHEAGRLSQVTVDHSLVGEMVRAGSLDPEEARNHPDRNVITRAIGAEDTLQVDFFRVSLKEHPQVMMCTDGLSGLLRDEEILQILEENGEETLQTQASLLVAAANEAGGPDNISVILVNTSPIDIGAGEKQHRA